MSVYVDRCRDFGWRLGPSCHLIADTLDDLHDLAARIGMRRSWFQAKASFPHYDLTVSKRAAAIRAGAIPLDDVPFVAKMRELREASRTRPQS